MKLQLQIGSGRILIFMKKKVNKNLLIFGTGNLGRTVKETAEAIGIFHNIAFLDDYSNNAIGKCSEYKKFQKDYLYAYPAFGNNRLRSRWIDIVEKEGFLVPILIHPTAYINPTAKILKGCLIGANAVVNTDVVIDRGCIISAEAFIDNGSFIGECSNIDIGAIIKPNSIVNKMNKVEAGKIYSNPNLDVYYSFEIGV
ncbi:MAG: hypothetical protein EWM47_00735 [Anaerolineaceae bacterium]|nr:MAG: hypothetical protein EWM47_00735 [Anaerolineaceae bacterium]